MNTRCGVATVSNNDVYRWETERRSPDAYLPHIAAVLGLRADVLLALVRGTLPEGAASPPAHLSEPEDDVDRRDFSGAMVGALAAVSLGTETARADESSRRLGAADIEQRRAALADLRRLDDFTGGANTHPLAVALVDELERMLRQGTYAEQVGTQLLSALAEAGQFAAWTAFDSGQLPAARAIALKATRAANEAGNRLLASSTLSELAYLTASSSTPKEAVQMARAAWTSAPSGALPAARVVLADRWAYACARTGDQRGVDRALGLSQDAHDEREARRQEEPDWLYWINRDESNIMVGRCWAELRNASRAVPVLEQVTAPYDDTHAREVALYQCWLAGAYLDGGEVEQAAGAAERAVELNGATRSPRTARWVDGVLQRLGEHRQVPAARAVLERAAAV